MKLSEITQSYVDELSKKAIYGVVVDEFLPSTLSGLEEIGFLLIEEEGDFSLDLMDSILSYTTIHTKVVLEVPFESEIEPSKVMAFALSCGLTVSVLPPQDLKNNINTYAEKLETYGSLWLNQLTTKNSLYPVSGYLQYLIQDCFSFKPDTISTDNYINNRFVNGYDIEDLDKVKDLIKPSVYNHFGGYDRFEIFCHSLAKASVKYIVDTVDKKIKEA